MAKIQELEDFKLSDAVKFNDTLNPAIWQDEKLKPEVREQLEKIARHFAEYLGVSDLRVEDITISGSNAAFTWTPHSDLDLHLLVDFSKLPDSDVYRELFNAKKMLYNDDHSITVKGLPVELYVQDTNDVHHSAGEYSVLNDDWNSIPKKEKPNFDEAATKLKYEKLGELVELALKSKDLKKVENVLSIVKRYRKAGLSKTGEFGPENVAYKAVRKQGLIQELFDLKKELESKDLSIDEQLNETVEESEIVNLLSRYVAKDIMKLLTVKDKNAVDYILGINADKDRREKLMTFGIDFLDFDIPKINDKTMLSYLKDLRVLVVNGLSTGGATSEGVTLASYGPLSQVIKVYPFMIKMYAEHSGVSFAHKLASSLAHEIQHHIDNMKSTGAAFEKPSPTNREEYLRLPYEVNARMQEAFLNMGRVVLSHQRDDEPISNDLLKTYIMYALEDSQLDEVYKKHQAQYKQLVKRIYKYADKVIHSPATVSPPTFAQKIVAFINGKSNLGVISETETLDKPELTIPQLARKHKVSVTDIKKQVAKGIKVELEHTSDRAVAREIALDHLAEDPKYYDKLAKMELEESSGYIPSEKEKNDPRFKTALTKDVRPNAIKKNAKAFNWKTNRAGVPPEAKTNGKIAEELQIQWEQFLAEEQQDFFPGYEKQHREKQLDKWLQNTLAWDGAKPKIVYHATTHHFDQFKTRNNKGFASVMGMPFEIDRHGAFFAEDPKFAEEFILPPEEWENPNPTKYKENSVVIPVYLSVQNPIDLTDQGLSNLIRNKELVTALEDEGIDITFIYRHMYEHLRWELFDGEEGVRFIEALEKMGFDSAVFIEQTQNAKSGRVWVAFHPTQIKSAIGNRGSYSKDDPRITKESS